MTEKLTRRSLMGRLMTWVAGAVAAPLALRGKVAAAFAPPSTVKPKRYVREIQTYPREILGYPVKLTAPPNRVGPLTVQCDSRDVDILPRQVTVEVGGDGRMRLDMRENADLVGRAACMVEVALEREEQAFIDAAESVGSGHSVMRDAYHVWEWKREQQRFACQRLVV